MLALYMRPSCGSCHEVLMAANRLGIMLMLRSTENPEHAQMLLVKGGKLFVPYLFDEERGVGFYGPELIIEYLENL